MIYARMEELSFRTGAATVAGVVAVAATAILLTLTQGAHHGAPRAQAALPASSLVGAPVQAASPSAVRQSHHRRSATPIVHYVPGPTKTPTARPQPAPSSPSPPRPRHIRTPPVTHGPPRTPGYPWPWPTPPWP
jgi:hypothetical protein